MAIFNTQLLCVSQSSKLCNKPVFNIITLCPGFGGIQKSQLGGLLHTHTHTHVLILFCFYSYIHICIFDLMFSLTLLLQHLNITSQD